MTSNMNPLTNAIKILHEDEDGMEAIQVVMIVAIAAIVLVFLKTIVWPKTSDWVKEQLEPLGISL